MAFVSLEAAACIVCILLFWWTIPKFDSSTSSESSHAAPLGPAIHDESMALLPGRLLSEGKREEATAAAGDLLQKNKWDVKANICAGNVFVAVGLKDDGLKCLKNAVYLSRRDRFVVEDYAENLADAGRIDEAIAQFEILASTHPEWQQPHLELARLYMSANKPAEAAAQFKAVLANNDKNFPARKLMAICLARASRVKEGLNEYVMANTEEAQSGVPQAIKTILGEKGRDAIDRVSYELQQQVTNKPDEYVPKLRLAQLYQYTGTPENLAQAKDLLMEARSLQPNNAEIHRTLALVLRQMGGNDNQALSEFAQSVKLEAVQEKERTGATEKE
jgi:tetratricopeptide (TPR) repeat protein